MDKTKVDEQHITVDELIEALKQHSENDLGDYLVGCNNEYRLIKGYSADIDHTKKTIDLGAIG